MLALNLFSKCKIKCLVCFILGLTVMLSNFCAASLLATISAKADKTVYAYMNEDTMLYSLIGTQYVSQVVLPKTYFVALLEPVTDNPYIKVSYADINGFMEVSKLEIVDYEPVTKYARRFATVSNDGLYANLRKTPDHVSGEVLSPAQNAASVIVYGSINGTALIPAVGNSWYYVKYTADNVNYFGYIYNTHLLTEPLKDNVIEKVPPPPNETPTEIIPSPPQMSRPMQIIFIVALCLPSAAVMLFIFKKPNKHVNSPRQKAD